MIKDSLDVIQQHFYVEMMKNLSKVEYPERYHNWYQGYTRIQYPINSFDNKLYIDVNTYAISGNISTPNFDAAFNADKW